MTRILATLLLLCVPSLAMGQTITQPEKVLVPVNRMAAVVIQYEGGKLDWWVNGAIDADIFREYDPNPGVVRLRILAYRPQVIYLNGVSTKDNNSAKAVTVIIVGEPGPEPPKPDPKPDPKPIDELQTKLQAVLSGEPPTTDLNGSPLPKLTAVQRLAGLYRGAMDTAKEQNLKTVKELNDKFGAARVTLIGNALPSIRAVLTEYFDATLPRATTAPLDDATRALCAKTFERVAKALEGLK